MTRCECLSESNVRWKHEEKERERRVLNVRAQVITNVCIQTKASNGTCAQTYTLRTTHCIAPSRYRSDFDLVSVRVSQTVTRHENLPFSARERKEERARGRVRVSKRAREGEKLLAVEATTSMIYYYVHVTSSLDSRIQNIIFVLKMHTH